MKFKINNKYIVDAPSYQKAVQIVRALDSKTNDQLLLDDQIASSSKEFFDIINAWLKSDRKWDSSEKVQIKGNILSGKFQFGINGGQLLINYTHPSGQWKQYHLKITNNSVSMSDVNDVIRDLYSIFAKASELKNKSYKLIGVKLEFYEGRNQSMLNKLVSPEKLLAWLVKEDSMYNDKNFSYHKAYVDCIYDVEGTHYRVHGGHIDVGDGESALTQEFKANMGWCERELKNYLNSGLSHYVKSGDSCTKDDNTEYLTEEELKAIQIVRALDDKKMINPNFNKDKWGKYFDKNGRLKPELAQEYFREYSKAQRELEKKDSCTKDDDTEYLTEEELKAVEDYKRAIANTSDPKMLKIFSHILSEETEHIEELQNGEMTDSDTEDAPEGFDQQYAKEANELSSEIRKANADYKRLGNKSASDLFTAMGYKVDGENFYKRNGQYERVIEFRDFDDIRYYVLKDGKIPKGWTWTRTKWYDSCKKDSDIKMTNNAINTAQAIEYERILRTHEKKAKSELIKEKTKEYIAQGIDRTTAAIMAKTFYEYGI